MFSILGSVSPDLRLLDEMRARLLALPIFYKVLIANSMIVVLGAVAGSSLTLALSDYIGPAGRIELIALFACLGTLLSVGVNVAVLKAALSPLVHLEHVVDEVRTGNMAARASTGPFVDPDVQKLTDTINEMLDSIDSYRRQVQAMSAEVLLAQEDERKRVARELHDSAGQLLTGLLLGLKALEGSADPSVRSAASDLLAIASETMEEVKRTAVALRPPALDDLGLVAALQGLIASYASTTGIDARFSAGNLSVRLPAMVELVLYRVVQEALTNAAKHARPGRVEVSLNQEEQRVEAVIVDDGQGFDVALALRSRERGLGLFGMRERVALVGGTFHIESRNGTRISVAVPLANSHSGVPDDSGHYQPQLSSTDRPDLVPLPARLSESWA